MSNNTGGPAFPAPAGVQHITEQGMTLRDYFASKAMQGDWAAAIAGANDETIEQAAARYYRMADAMLRVREAT